MARYETDSLLAVAYKSRVHNDSTFLTHVFDTETETALCKKAKYEHRTEEGIEEEVATCPVCARRDPRSKSNGPRALTHLFQF